ncbi:MAG: hypothetical protein Q8867_10050, partial [Bacteroidota bacterium]|nr:hypothetical protein [Bacteroidota bacterium]
RNLVRSFFLNQREERIYPLLTMAILYYITYYVMKGITASLFFNFYMLGATLLSVVALIISFYYKISLHMLGWGGCLGMLFGLVISFGFDMFWPVSVTIAIVGIIGTARLKLNSHKPSEIYSGFLAGAAVMFIIFCLI